MSTKEKVHSNGSPITAGTKQARAAIAAMSHLMQRAGFGASYDELERRAARGYETTVEELIHPENQPDFRQDLAERYFTAWQDIFGLPGNQTY